MIVYIASYPRSGNSWVQQLITWQFRRLTTSVYPTKLPDSWGIRVVPEAPGLDVRALLWNEWTALYDSRQPDCERKPTHRFIMPGCMPLLTTKNRQRLAGEKEIFFIKTHELPFSEYFEGERVIQVVRNPGAACWSYYHTLLLADAMERSALGVQDGDYKTLTDVVRGDVKFGSWTNYHRAWEETAAVLGGLYLLVSFEGLGEHQTECCRIIEQFSGARLLLREHLSFEQIHAMSHTGKPSGQALGWERHYFKHQLDLLWELHGEIMERFGYLTDDSLSMECSQLARAEQELNEVRPRAVALKETLKRVEADSKVRLTLLRQHEAEVTEWRARAERVEVESQARLDLLRQREAEVTEWKARAATAEESVKRLDCLRQQEAESQKLGDEIEHWKNEGPWARLLRRVRAMGPHAFGLVATLLDLSGVA